MSWTAPRTWVTAEVVTAAIGNTHWRDNLAWLGTDKPHCRVHNSANISVADNSIQALTFDSERFDIGAMHDTVTNTSRITIPTGGAGKYLVGGNMHFANNATGNRGVHLRKNNTDRIGESVESDVAADTQVMQAWTLWNFAVADYVTLGAFQTSGAALNVLADTDPDAFSPEFWAIWLGT